MRGGCGGHHGTSTEQLEIGGILLVRMRAGICATTCGKGRSDKGEEDRVRRVKGALLKRYVVICIQQKVS